MRQGCCTWGQTFGVGRLQQTGQAPAFTLQWEDREWVGEWWAPRASERSLWGLETR